MSLWRIQGTLPRFAAIITPIIVVIGCSTHGTDVSEQTSPSIGSATYSISEEQSPASSENAVPSPDVSTPEFDPCQFIAGDHVAQAFGIAAYGPVTFRVISPPYANNPRHSDRSWTCDYIFSAQANEQLGNSASDAHLTVEISHYGSGIRTSMSDEPLGIWTDGSAQEFASSYAELYRRAYGIELSTETYGGAQIVWNGRGTAAIAINDSHWAVMSAWGLPSAVTDGPVRELVYQLIDSVNKP